MAAVPSGSASSAVDHFERRLLALERKAAGYSDLRDQVSELQSLLSRLLGVYEQSMGAHWEVTESLMQFPRGTLCKTNVCADALIKPISIVDVQVAEATSVMDATVQTNVQGATSVEDIVAPIAEAIATHCAGAFEASCYTATGEQLQLVVEDAQVQDRKEAPENEGTAGDPDSSWALPTRRFSSLRDEEFGEMYAIDMSVWDAFIFIFFRAEDGESFFSLFETASLLMAFALNLSMQGVFALIVYNLTQNSDFNFEHIRELLDWRASRGHVLDTAGTGTTEVARLCRNRPWSFQSSAVSDLNEYWETARLLHFDAGRVLSIMSLILWSMNIMKEYRSVLEQLVGILSIPRRRDVSHWSLSLGEITMTGSGEELKGSFKHIGGGMRCLVILSLSVPRMIFLISLAIYGSQFVAQTASLVDLVLNALAVAFVFDIDEFLADVVFTQGVRRACQVMEPISSQRTGKPFLRDVNRLLLWLALIIASVIAFLIPFQHRLVAADFVLCSGDVDFIVEGGNLTMPTTIIVDMADAAVPGSDGLHITMCDAEPFATYLERYYPSSSLSSSFTQEDEVANRTDVETRKKHIVLQHAFRGIDLSQQVREVSDFFNQAIINQVPVDPPGAGVVGLVDCPRFESSYQLGWDACVPMPSLDSLENCSWSRVGQLCEGDSPGGIYRAACDVSNEEAQAQSCSIWRSFGVENPLANCPHAHAGSYTHELHGVYAFATSNATRLYEALQNESLRASLLDLMRTSFEELPPQNRLPYSSPLQLTYGSTSLLEFEGFVVFSGTGPSRRLDGSRRFVGQPADVRQLQQFPDELEVQFRIDMLPATLTSVYLSKVDWTKLSHDTNQLVIQYDASLHVGPGSAVSSSVSAANCSSYAWCWEADKILKSDARLIPGATEDVCCDESCLFLARQGLLSQAVCEPLGPYELIVSEGDQTATRVFEDFTLCCVEQQLCQVLPAESCADIAGPSYDTLVLDASTRHQGVTGSGMEVDCCAMSCEALAEHGIPAHGSAEMQSFVCNAAQRQALVRNASEVVPSDIYDEAVVVATCCELTPVTCAEWDAQNPDVNCLAINNVLIPEASATFGEHSTICCTESCANLNIQCPAGYSVWPTMDVRARQPLEREAFQTSMSEPPTVSPTLAPTIVATACSTDADLVGPEGAEIIPDESISASSYSDSDVNCGFENTVVTRLQYPWSAWCADAQDGDQWLQWDFGIPTRITAIQTQGHPIDAKWVTSYAVSFSMDGLAWSTMPGTFAGNGDSVTVRENVISATVSRYVRIIPQSWFNAISMRSGASGCAANEGYNQTSWQCPSGFVPYSGHLNTEVDDVHTLLCDDVSDTLGGCAAICNATQACLAFEWSASESYCRCSSVAKPNTDVVMGDGVFCGKLELHVSSESACCTPLLVCSDFTDEDCIAEGSDILVESNTTVDGADDFASVCCHFSCSSAFSRKGYECPNKYALTANASTVGSSLSSHAIFELDCCVAGENVLCDETLYGFRGSDYRGCQDHTKSGIPCQAWSSQSPHPHDRTPVEYPDAGLGDHSFCRNPDGELTIWCYTLVDNPRWEHCDPVPPPRNCETTGGTVAEGTPCFFPFEYDGTMYDRCPDLGPSGGSSWCSVTSGYGGLWTNCVCGGSCICEPDYIEEFARNAGYALTTTGYGYTSFNRMCASDGTEGTVPGTSALCAGSSSTGVIRAAICDRGCIESRCTADANCQGYSHPTDETSWIPLSSVGTIEEDRTWQTFKKSWR